MPYTPVPPTFGGALRVFHILRLLLRKHEVTVLTFGDQNDEKELQLYFNNAIKDIHIMDKPWVRANKRFGQLYSLFSSHSFFYMMARDKKMQNKLEELLSKNKYDIILTEFSHTASYDMNSSAVKIMDAHNVEHEIFKKMWLNAKSPLRRFYYKTEFKKFYREEIVALKRHDAIFTTSMNDKNILDQEVPEISKFVIPNGVEADYFRPSGETPEPFSLVFTGAMSYVPNYDGILHFLNTTFPLILKSIPNAKLYVVGNNPPPVLLKRSADNVIITGFVEDVRPYIKRSSVYIVPLRMGSGTRLKVLEAMSMKIPIVTTSMGSEGINVVDGKSALIADNPRSFADAVINLLRNKNLRDTLIENGFNLMKSEYEWTVIGDNLEQILNSLLNNKQKNSFENQ